MNCKAKKSNGEPCKARAILGGSVCRVHGGSAPQVRAAALARIQALVHPALDTMQKALTCEHDAVAVAAARDLLDRAGYKVSDKHELTGPDGGAMKFEISVSFHDPQ